jgi:5-oxoprolinase (ATP-hydrolysing)
VQADLDDDYITPEGAKHDYGVILGANGRIDSVATARRRAEGKDADSALATTTGGSP